MGSLEPPSFQVGLTVMETERFPHMVKVYCVCYNKCTISRGKWIAKNKTTQIHDPIENQRTINIKVKIEMIKNESKNYHQFYT